MNDVSKKPNQAGESLVNKIPKRPQITDEMVLEAAKELCRKINVDEDYAEDIAKHYYRGIDGYELAKRLDYDGWEVDINLVNDLDHLDFIVKNLIYQAEKQWVIDNDIQPPLPIGTRITRGVIEGIEDNWAPACYRVKENGCTISGRYLLVKFEDAIPV